MDIFKGFISFFFIAMILLQSGCKDNLELHRGLSEQDANAIVAELNNKGIVASKHADKSSYSVSIATSDFPDAVKILQAAGLPSQTYSSMGDLFRKEGLISSPLEERIRYIFALSQELEFTLSQIDGVIMARVHIVLPDRIAVGETIQPASAAVFIKYKHDANIEVMRANIRRLILSSIPGMVDADDKKLAISFIPSSQHALKHEPPQNERSYKIVFFAVGGLCFLLALYLLLPIKKVQRKWLQTSTKDTSAD